MVASEIAIEASHQTVHLCGIATNIGIIRRIGGIKAYHVSLLVKSPVDLDVILDLIGIVALIFFKIRCSSIRISFA